MVKMNETRQQIADAIRRYNEERGMKIKEFIKSLTAMSDYETEINLESITQEIEW